jgi:PAS domain S-box-containing protein
VETPAPNAADVPDAGNPVLVLERMSEGFYAIDPAWRFRYVNAAAEAFWRRSRADLLGRTMFEVFPRFHGSPAWAAHERAMRSGEHGRVETVSTATGIPVELRLFPAATGLSVYFQDLARRRQMEQELKTRDELLTLAETSAGIGVWVADLTKGTVEATPQFFRLLGLEPVEGPVPQDVARQVRHPDDRDRITQGFREAIASGADTFDSEYRIIRPSGEVRWIFGRGRVTRDAAGHPWRYAGVDIDITERKQQEEHLRVVMRELLHRTNNLLAVVQGLARESARTSPNPEDFTSSFSARLKGLGVSSSLLARQDWRGAMLDELLRAQVGPFAATERLAFSGPAVLLSPRAVQNLGLAFHELATNAIKYGALSVSGGTLRVDWQMLDRGGEPSLHLVWKELGGPSVLPPTRAGFGRVVSEQMLATALGAKVTTTFASDGLEWTLDLAGGDVSQPGLS